MLFFTKQKAIKLSEAGKLYLDYCELEKEMSPATIYEYGKTVKWTVDILGDIDIAEINENHITELKKEYNQRNLKPTTKAHNLSVIRELLKFCQSELHLNVLDPEKIKRPRIPKRRVDYLTEEELRQFFDAIGKRSIRDYRFRALVSVLVSTGCRISEALNLKLHDIDWKNRESMIVGKGNKQRKLYFTDWSLRCIREYIEKRGYEGKFIFVAEGKQSRWGRNDAQRNFRNYRKRLGLSPNLTAHTIRHSFATILLKKGISLGHIQVLLGHSDIQTTSRHYLGILSDEEAKKAHERGMNMDNWL
ncbi:MAG: tyrosine-type recombinase/integrase [Candidatus Moranbacteria bacterium]|nr:tyrosine-type recombinase/integrase [Candidatus Moranbacteria bacterium]